MTNGLYAAQIEKLEQLDLRRYFDQVVASSRVGKGKPAPEMFAGIDASFMIGDSLDGDVDGAQAAGIRSVWLNRNGERRLPDDPEPDHEIRSLAELPALLS